MPRPVHFDLSVQDPERAVAFYRDTFGWRIDKWSGPMDYWLVDTGEGEPGIHGGFAHRQPGEQPCTTLTLSVPNLEEAMAAVTRNGGQVTMGKSAIPGVGWFASCVDTEGNRFGIMQPDEAAR